MKTRQGGVLRPEQGEDEYDGMTKFELFEVALDLAYNGTGLKEGKHPLAVVLYELLRRRDALRAAGHWRTRKDRGGSEAFEADAGQMFTEETASVPPSRITILYDEEKDKGIVGALAGHATRDKARGGGVAEAMEELENIGKGAVHGEGAD